MRRLVPDVAVIVAQATRDQSALITREVLGLGESVIAQCVKMIGSAIIGRTSPVAGPFRAYFATRRLVRLPGGVGELAATELPHKLGDLLGRTFGFKVAYTIGIADDVQFFGALHLLARTAEEVFPVRAIESFAYQCFLTLSNLRAQSALRESEQKYRMLTESIKDVV